MSFSNPHWCPLSEIKIGFDRGSRAKDHVSIIGGKYIYIYICVCVCVCVCVCKKKIYIYIYIQRVPF